MKFLAKSLAVLALTVSSAANATIIDNGSYTTINGQDWLDLSLTDGLSVNQALAANSGWEWATKAQFQSMFAEFETAGDGWFMSEEAATATNVFGASLFTQHFLVRDDVIQNQFEDLFGSTVDGVGGVLRSYGFYDDGGDLLMGGVYESDTEALTYDNYDNVYSDSRDHAEDWVGIYLVRGAEVPEPSIIALMGLGLAGLGFSRFKSTTLSIQQ